MTTPEQSHPARRDKNWMGIVAIIAAFVVPIAGIVLGHMGVSAARRGEADNGDLARVGLILSYVVELFALAILGVIVWLIWRANT